MGQLWQSSWDLHTVAELASPPCPVVIYPRLRDSRECAVVHADLGDSYECAIVYPNSRDRCEYAVVVSSPQRPRLSLPSANRSLLLSARSFVNP